MSLRGKSAVAEDKHEAQAKAAQARKKRERERLELSAAVSIQAFFRKWRECAAFAAVERAAWDRKVHDVSRITAVFAAQGKAFLPPTKVLLELTRAFVFFTRYKWDGAVDLGRTATLCRFLHASCRTSVRDLSLLAALCNPAPLEREMWRLRVVGTLRRAVEMLHVRKCEDVAARASCQDVLFDLVSALAAVTKWPAALFPDWRDHVDTWRRLWTLWLAGDNVLYGALQHLQRRLCEGVASEQHLAEAIAVDLAHPLPATIAAAACGAVGIELQFGGEGAGKHTPLSATQVAHLPLSPTVLVLEVPGAAPSSVPGPASAFPGSASAFPGPASSVPAFGASTTSVGVGVGVGTPFVPSPVFGAIVPPAGYFSSAGFGFSLGSGPGAGSSAGATSGSSGPVLSSAGGAVGVPRPEDLEAASSHTAVARFVSTVLSIPTVIKGWCPVLASALLHEDRSSGVATPAEASSATLLDTPLTVASTSPGAADSPGGRASSSVAVADWVDLGLRVSRWPMRSWRRVGARGWLPWPPLCTS